VKEINPGVAAAIIVVILLVAGGLWYFSTKGPGGVPSTGQSGRSDPFLAGQNNILKQKGKVDPNMGGGRPFGGGMGAPGR